MRRKKELGLGREGERGVDETPRGIERVRGPRAERRCLFLAHVSRVKDENVELATALVRYSLLVQGRSLQRSREAARGNRFTGCKTRSVAPRGGGGGCARGGEGHDRGGDGRRAEAELRV